MAKFFMGVDYGTGGAKTCIMDEEANVRAYAFREYPILTNNPGWSEHDPALYWRYFCEMSKECLQKSGVASRDIKAVALSAAAPSMVMLDGRGQPINNAYNLMDRRAKDETRWIYERVGRDRLRRVTVNNLEDHPVLVNLLWEKNHRPADYRRIREALTVDGYIRFVLTGEATFHLPSGFGFGVAYDMRKGMWDQEILDMIGIEREILPRPTVCEEIVGVVRPEAAAECGLCPGTPVAGGQLDCNASWLGAGAIREGDTQINLGTVGNFGVIHRDTNFVDDMLVAAYTVDCKNTYVTVPTTTTGGQTLRYIRDNFCQAERGLEGILPINTYDMLNLEAERVPAGSDGVMVLPYLMGERCPIWDVDARGVVFGLSLMHTKGHVVRAAMEGVAYALYDSFRRILASGKKINMPIVFNEGGAKSRLWRGIITDVFNVPTVVCESRIGAPLGDAALAAYAQGAFKDYEILREKARYVDPIEPDKARNELYMRNFGLFKSVYEHIKEDYKTLAAYREVK